MTGLPQNGSFFLRLGNGSCLNPSSERLSLRRYLIQRFGHVVTPLTIPHETIQIFVDCVQFTVIEIARESLVARPKFCLNLLGDITILPSNQVSIIS